MGLWNDARKAAEDARAQRAELRAMLVDLAQRITGQRRAPPEEPPTLTVDAHGNAHHHGEPNALVILGQSLVLAASSLLAAGLAWLAAFFLGLWLFIQRVFGLAPAAATAH